MSEKTKQEGASEAAAKEAAAKEAAASRKPVITHPFTALKVGGKYSYRRPQPFFAKPVECTIQEIPRSIAKGKVTHVKVVNFANTPADVVTDVSDIPNDGEFTEA